MINKLTLSGLILLFSAISIAPQAIAQEGDNDTRIEKFEDLTETELDSAESDVEDMEDEDPIAPETRTEETLESVQSNDSSVNYDVRRTEAFNLVSSGYRGDFEDQGINSYAVFVLDYESGDLTAEDLVEAAIEAGELSPSAMEDDSYLDAVDDQLNSLTST